MINTVEFTNRLKKIMEHYQLTATLFADKIGVQRSSISHILSGRNKPSLDFVLKVTSQFTDVDIHWLLKGEGVFPKLEEPNPSFTPTSLINNSSAGLKKKIQRIVTFYSDGTFDVYNK